MANEGMLLMKNASHGMAGAKPAGAWWAGVLAMALLVLVVLGGGTARAQDADLDGLSDGEEAFLGTNPDAQDTDDDGIPDLHEIIGDPTGVELPETQYLSHPTYSMAHFDPTLTNALGQVLTPPRSLDLSVVATAAGAAWMGIAVPNPTRFETMGANGWTFETWVRPVADDTTGSLIAYRLGTGQIGAEIGISNGLAYARFQTAGGIWRTAGGVTAGNVSLATNRWQYLAGVWDPTTRALSLHVNGQKFGTTSFLPPAQGVGAMYIGGRGVAGEDATVLTAGRMDEVRLWRAARTGDEIRTWQDRFLQFPPMPSQLRAYYRFDDAGLTIEDFAGGPVIDPLTYGVGFPAFPNGYGLNFSAVGTSDWVPTADALALRDIDDDDLDLLPDWWEQLYSGSETILEPFMDEETDGLNNLYEFRCRTNPYDLDTDNNSVADGLEDLDQEGLNNSGEQRWLVDPQEVDTDDDNWTDRQEVDRGTSPRHPMSRPDFATASFDGASNATPDIGVAIPENQRFAFGGGGWTVECWFNATEPGITGDLFTYLGLNGESLRMGLTNGVPFGEIYSGVGVVASVGGTNSVPPLELNTWVHLAISFSPEDNTFRLFRDGFLLIAKITLARPNILLGDAFLARGLTAGYLDELRIWAEARNPDALERWQHKLIPSFEIVDAGSFDPNRYLDELQPESPSPAGEADPLYVVVPAVAPPETVNGVPPPPAAWWNSIYSYSADNLLRLYYRFDDGGPSVEDFSQFQDRDFYLATSGSAVQSAQLQGTDDADDDALPDWWVDLYALSSWNDVYHGTTLEVRGDLNVDGLMTETYTDPPGNWSPGNRGPWSAPPPEDAWPRPLPLRGHIQRDFVAFGSFGSAYSHEENFELIHPKSRIFHDSGQHVSLVKYFVLALDPVTATLNLRIDKGAATSVRVNGIPVALSGTGSTNVASLLHKGRNQISIQARDTAGRTQSYMVQPPYSYLYNPGGQTPVIEEREWPPQLYTWPLAVMKIDTSLNVDGVDVVARGDDAKFDPRTVWHGRVVTDLPALRLPDQALRLPEHPDYGVELDSDADGIPNYVEFLTGDNPKDGDTDNDGIPDADEDLDQDALSNRQEVEWGTDPRLADTDDDDISDSLELARSGVPTDGNSPLTSRALQFAGGGQAELPRQRRLALTNWSLEMRVRPDAGGGTLLERTVGSVSNAPLINYGLRLSSSNTVVAYFSDINGKLVQLETLRTIPATGSNWTHLAATYDLNTRTMSLYLDSTLAAQSATNFSPVTYGPGGALTTLGAGYAGLIDELRIWSTARSLALISGSARATLSGQEAGLVAYYRFDDAGLTAQDGALSSRGDWVTGWRNAARLVNPQPNAVQFVDLTLADVALDADSDGDGLPDYWELLHGLDPFDPNGDNGAFGDPDGDGLWNINEYRGGLHPNEPSTFNDGVTDGLRDSDGDGLSNRHEQDSTGSRVDLVDTDDDSYTDWEEVTGHRLGAGWQPTTNSTQTLLAPPVTAAPGPVSNPLRSVDPLRHQSATFDGTGALVVNSRDSLALLSWTLQAWVRPQAGANGVVIMRAVTNTAFNVVGINYELGVKTNSAGALTPYALYQGFVPGTTTGAVVQVDGTTPGEIQGGQQTTMEIAPAEWTHLTATYDHENHVLSLYINGDLASYRRDAFTPWGLGVYEGIRYDGEVMVGGYRAASGAISRGFEGHIDDATVIGGAADAGRVRQAATTGLPMRSVLLAGSRTPPSTPSALTVQQALGYPHPAGEILVRFRDTVTPAQVPGLAQNLGTSVARSYRIMPIHLLRVADGAAMEQKLNQLRASPDVVYAEPNYRVQAFRSPSDPSFERQWGLKNSGQTGGTPDADISASVAWDRTTGQRDVVVAVIDTGVDYNHTDLAANIWTNEGEIAANQIDDDGNGFVDDVHGYDFANDDADPVDDDGHGSHCAGVIGAVGNNGIGIAGLNWNVQIMALKFLGLNGGTLADAIDAIDYVVQQGVRISNNSWGGFGFSQSLYDAIAIARARNHLFVAAAGNSGLNIDEWPVMPGGFDLDNIVSVAASDHNDTLASFSNYGERNVDLAAPGVSIYSTVLNNGYASMDGTSMASPHAAGTAALILGLYPKISYEALKLALLNSVDPVDGFDGLMVTGGRLNAGAAVTGAGLTLLYLAFDDGGNTYDGERTAEDFTVSEDWNADWANAARFHGGAAFATNEFFRSNTDSNGDGIPDWWAEAYGFDPRGSPIAGLDGDNDGVNNHNEYLAGTHPGMVDSNGNGTRDGDEDLDRDGLTALQEQEHTTHPLLADTDDDGRLDGLEVNEGTDPLSAHDPEAARAMAFDGSRRLLVRQETAESMVNDWTVEAWVQPAAALQNAVLLRRAESAAYNGQRRVDYELGLASGVPYVEFAYRHGSTITVERVSAPSAIPSTRWVHLAAVRSSTNDQLRLFVDGKRVAYKRPVTIPAQTQYGSFQTVIGGGDLVGSSVTRAFVGQMDAVRVWNYARSGLEIQGSRGSLLPEFVDGVPDGNRAPTHVFNFDDGGAFAENSRYVTDWLNLWAHAAEVQGGTAGAVGNFLVASAFPPLTLDDDDDGAGNVDEASAYWLPLRSESPYSNRFVRFANTGANTVVVDELVDDQQTGLFAVSNWTVEAWARLHVVPATSVSLVRRVTDSTGWLTFDLGVTNVAGGARPYARFQRGDAGRAMVTVLGAAPLPIGTNEAAWTHLAATLKNGRLALHVNGSEVGFSVAVGALPSLGQGARVEMGAPGLVGDLQEVRIWKVARTAAQIAERYRQALLFSTTLLERSYLASGQNAYLARPTADAENGYIYDHSTIGYVQGLPYLAGRETHKFGLVAWIKMERGALGGIVAERKIDLALLPDQQDWRINHSLRITENGEPQAMWEGQLEIVTPVYNASNILQRLDINVEVVRRNLTSEVDIRDGQWHHLALVGDSLTVKLYIDGRLDSESLSYYVFRARPAPSFESFYWTYPPIDSVLRVADGGIQATIDEVMFWNEDLSGADVAQYKQYGLTKTDIQQGLQVIQPIPEFAVDDGLPHRRLVSYVTADGAMTSPFVPDAVQADIEFRMTPQPAGNELVSLTSGACPVLVDRLRALAAELAGYFAAVDGGTYLENFMERNNLGHAGLLGGGVRFMHEPFFEPAGSAHILLDSDGDGMPDWWESVYGMNASSIDGTAGSWSDPDLDGLPNVAEYQVTQQTGVPSDPLNPNTMGNTHGDFFNWNDTPGLTNHYRIFGEIYTDFDGIEDQWEVDEGLNPRRFDAHEDADGDGWSNLAEYDSSTSPLDFDAYPKPSIRVTVNYTGTRYQGPITALAYSKETMDGAPDAVGLLGRTQQVPFGPLFTTPAANQTAVNGQLTTVPVVPGSVTITIGAPVNLTFQDLGNGTLRTTSAQPVRFGTIDYTAGTWDVTTIPTVVPANTSVSAGWDYFVGVQGMPFDGSLAIIQGHLRQGPNWMFVYVDNDNDGTWTPGEPAGFPRGIPLNMQVGEVAPVVVDLNESQPQAELPDYEMPGFARFAWPVRANANSYRIRIRNMSAEGGPQVIDRIIEAPRHYFHERDFALAGFIGMPQAGYEWFAYHHNNNVDLIITNGTFVVTYPTVLATPSITTPESTIWRYARNVLQWRSVVGAVAYRVHLSRTRNFAAGDLIVSALHIAPVPDRNGVVTYPVPALAGDANLPDGTYYWRVQAQAPGATTPLRSNWSRTNGHSVGVNLADGPAGPYSISGDVIYFGKVTNGTFVVQAFNDAGHSLTPLAQRSFVNASTAAEWPTNRMAYVLSGLPAGTHYVRAFLDQDGDGARDDWETMGSVRATAYESLALSTPPSLTRQDVMMVMADTDNDRIADDWEWQYRGNLTDMGAGTVRGYTDSNGDGVSDFESYAATPMNVNPMVPYSAGPDGVPMAVKLAFGIAPDETIYFDVSSMTWDSQGRPVMRWFALPSGNSRGGLGGRATQDSGTAEVQYQVQYSPNGVGTWLDVVSHGKVVYDPASNQFEFVDTYGFDTKGFYRYKVIFNFY